MTRRLAVAALGASLLATLGYTFAYLAGWEWHRATITALFSVLALVALVGALAAGRAGRAGDPGTGRTPAAASAAASLGGRHDERTREALRRARPRRPFRWLDPGGDCDVFIPLLLGAGVLLSGVGWLVERLARAAGAPAAERRLARRLAAIAPPETLIDLDDAPDAFCTPGARP